MKDAGLKEAGYLQDLEAAAAAEPTSQQLAVGIYIAMASEILVRTDCPADKLLQDCKALHGFMSSVLKIQKKSLPGSVNAAMDKLQKDFDILHRQGNHRFFSMIVVDSRQ